ncbi:MAG: nucleotidyltransferase [Lachnospiraceae bacterium]|nr:nucleotidyltransferase [Lachnospiraceae bacterium]
MKEPVLVILAAGMGSRYGGLKQIDPVDDQGNKIIDFSIFDAVRAGFKKAVFIIKEENLNDFKQSIGDAISSYIDIEYVFQDVSMVPEGFTVPKDRTKPWGTAHAVLCIKGVVDSPFAVINADDFYGREAYRKIYDFLAGLNASEKDGADGDQAGGQAANPAEAGYKDREKGRYDFAMVGYALKNTLTENGSVSRGVCTVSENGELLDIVERTQIEKHPDQPAYTENGKDYIPISGDSIVSMNLWGFSEGFIKETEDYFKSFLENEMPKNPLKAEFYLPFVVDRLINEGRAKVSVLKSDDKWFGVTYKEDKPFVTESVKKLKAEGVYPEILWKRK